MSRPSRPPSWLALLTAVAVASLAPWPACADGAAPLGRVFMSPAQRRALDEERARLHAPDTGALPRDLLPAGASPSQRLVLNGVLRRSDAPPLVWINGKPARAGATLRRGPDAQDRVTVGSGDGSVSARLKPGQAWDPVTGKVTDCLQCGLPEKSPASEPPAPPEPAAASASAEPATVASAAPPAAAAPPGAETP